MASAPQSADYAAEEASWVDSVLTGLTLEERVGQLFMPSAYARTGPENMRRLREYVADCHVGGVLFLKGDARSLRCIVDTLQRMAAVPMFMAMDAEWGLAMRLQDAPRFPMQGDLDNCINDQLMYDYGREVAREARLVGLNMLMGPVMDVLTDPANRVIGKRSIGADPHRVAALATAYARGMEDGSVMSVAKHFPGHGGITGDSHYMLPVNFAPFATLDSVDLLPFRHYISQHLSGIMVGHLYMPALDSVRRSASLSDHIIKELLVHRLGFRGLVVTDAVNMKGAVAESPVGLSALLAGADIVLSPQNTAAEIDSVLAALRDGRMTLQELNGKCRKILTYKYRFERLLRCSSRLNMYEDLHSPETLRLQHLLSR